MIALFNLSVRNITKTTSYITDIAVSYITNAPRWVALSSANGQTTVRLGRTSVVLASVPLAAGQTVSATATGSIASGESGVELQIAATLTGSTGATLVANGLTCAIPQGIDVQ